MYVNIIFTLLLFVENFSIDFCECKVVKFTINVLIFTKNINSQNLLR
jgi:hypothetical protein